jgi:hypothetical protein
VPAHPSTKDSTMKTNILIRIATATLFVGCASSGAQREPKTPSQETGMSMTDQQCPMKLPGTTVTSSDIDDGVVLTFTNPSDVSALRQRVRGMATMHKRYAPGGTRYQEGTAVEERAVPGNEGGAHDGMTTMPAAAATAKNSENGAQLILRPNDPSQLGDLRKHAQMHAEQMASGECPLM